MHRAMDGPPASASSQASSRTALSAYASTTPARAPSTIPGRPIGTPADLRGSRSASRIPTFRSNGRGPRCRRYADELR
jgi:hypothetical protein